LLHHAKANKLSYASSGHGTSLHLAGELFKRRAGIEMTHVPYRGAGPAFNDVIPGRIDAMINFASSSLPLVQQGQLRGLAVASAEPVEPRAEAKGNASQQSTRRTQSRVSVSHALERIRQA
jgi:tripartite-type tricarboxylate transporter receptor subunit TctC